MAQFQSSRREYDNVTFEGTHADAPGNFDALLGFWVGIALTDSRHTSRGCVRDALRWWADCSFEMPYRSWILPACRSHVPAKATSGLSVSLPQRSFNVPVNCFHIPAQRS